jgi:tetratricopeptide (TPR) repeat protein
MKKVFVLLGLLFSIFSYAQTNDEIAGVYLKRARKVIEESIDFKEAKVLYEKAMRYVDSVKTSDMAMLGARIYYELEEYKTAKRLSKKYFALVKNRKSEEYEDQLELAILITEELEQQEEEQKRLEEARIKKEKEIKFIDSLKTEWRSKAKSMVLPFDGIDAFNKYQVAIYRYKGKVGLLSDVGEIIVEANDFEDVVSFDGIFIFKDKANEPSKLYYYNMSTSEGFDIPALSTFNTLSTHYGTVMLPRANGQLVTYPNNSYEPFIFDLNTRSLVRLENQKELFKRLRKSDAIDKYNNDGEVKKDKTWYTFGGHLGGGVHPLYEENYVLSGFLFSIDGTFLSAKTDYQYIGPFYNNTMQAIQGNETIWVNQNGTKISSVEDQSKEYSGESRVVKTDGGFHIMQGDKIVLGDDKLETIEDFVARFFKK